MKHLAIIILAMLFMGCNSDNPQTETARVSAEVSGNNIRLSDEQLKNSPVETVSLEKKTVSGLLRLNGKVNVDPDHLVSLSSALGGYVKSVNVLPGKPVRKGETVLVLEDQQFVQLQQEYLTVKAQLLSAEPDYIRQKELNESKSASDKAMQQAETKYRSLLAAKSALEEKLRLVNIDPHTLTPESIRGSTRILAPFNGLVSKVLINKGKYVSPSDELVELINPDGLLLHVKVFEKDWSKIRVGQTLEVYTNQEPGKKIKATVITAGNGINEDGSTEIIAKVNKGEQANLAAGLYINALLKLDSYEAHTLPEDAVVSFEGKSYVFESAGNNSFRMLEVGTGTNYEGTVEITGADSLASKQLVGKGAYALLMALKNQAEE